MTKFNQIRPNLLLQDSCFHTISRIGVKLDGGTTVSDTKSRTGQPSKGTHLKWDSLEAEKSTKSSNLWECVGVLQRLLFVSALPRRPRSMRITQPRMWTFFYRAPLCFLFSVEYTHRRSSLPSSRLCPEPPPKKKKKAKPRRARFDRVPLLGRCNPAFTSCPLSSSKLLFYHYQPFLNTPLPRPVPLPVPLLEIKVKEKKKIGKQRERERPVLEPPLRSVCLVTPCNCCQRALETTHLIARRFISSETREASLIRIKGRKWWWGGGAGARVNEVRNQIWRAWFASLNR